MSEYLKWHKSTVGHTHMQDQAKNEIEQLREQLVKANERVNELDKSVLQEIKSRDNREEWLDAMAAEISRYFGVDIGEHSSANNPWDEAIQAIPTSTLNKFAIEKKIEAFEKYASMCEVFLTVPSIEGLRSHAEQLRKGQE